MLNLIKLLRGILLSDTSLFWSVGYLLIDVEQNPQHTFSNSQLHAMQVHRRYLALRHVSAGQAQFFGCKTADKLQLNCKCQWLEEVLSWPLILQSSPVGSTGTLAASSHPQAYRYTLCSKFGDESLLPVMSVDWKFMKFPYQQLVQFSEACLLPQSHNVGLSHQCRGGWHPKVD